ncbi:MAG: hydrolase, HAD-superfamily, subfamily [Streptosporangiaceae bacterium]|nr:hydrolase, HAD-superfamily, subfamily [Streptosporangiaceae bacterium]
MIRYSVVIPTLSRPCLTACLQALAAAGGPVPQRVVLVDDRPDGGPPIQVPPWLAGLTEVQVVVSGGRGPAAARNLGWRRTRTPWVAFLDDDVRVGPGWRAELAADLAERPPPVAGVQGRITVPLPAGRRPTDWERVTAGLARARWATADMAYRREALVEAGGFDERFRRAFREDADLALRLLADGWRLEIGARHTVHPVRPASPWVSVRAQAGNADDALMTALHGPDWRARADSPAGRRHRHLAITAAGLGAGALALCGRRRWSGLTAAAALTGIAEFAAARIRPGPRDAREVAAMAVTSLVIPPAAVWHWARGRWTCRGARPWPGPARAVLFDLYGTLARGHRGDARVVPSAGAREALDLLRARGVRVGSVSVRSSHFANYGAEAERRLARVLGPFDTWQVCPYGTPEDCACDERGPGAVERAAADLSVRPHECVLVGDAGTDLPAVRTAGVRSVLLTTAGAGWAAPEGVRSADGLEDAARFALAEGPGRSVWP